MGSIQEVKARAVEMKRDLNKAQESFAKSKSQQTTLIDYILSLTEEPSLVHIKPAIIKSDLGEMMALVQQQKNDVEMSFCNVSMEVQKINEEVVDVVKGKIQADGWKTGGSRWRLTSMLSLRV